MQLRDHHAANICAIGFRTRLVRLPEQRFTVIILANRADAEQEDFVNRIADILLFDGN